MMLFGKLVYLLSTQAYFLFVRLVAPFNRRAALLVAGQKNLLTQFKQYKQKKTTKSIWFHVASLGEFEQGKPIMLALKNTYPDLKLVITFFSPSGYEVRKNDPIADAVCYLPFESKFHAKLVIDCVEPMFAIWIKYDFWFRYLHELKRKNIPVYLCAAQFRKNQLFFKRTGKFQKSLLSYFDFIFCQNEHSSKLLKSIHFNKHLISGDNRYDRVYQTLQQAEQLPIIEHFKGSDFLIIAGSCYELEENLLLSAHIKLHKSFKIILAPHFVDEQNIRRIEKIFTNTIRYSKCTLQTEFSTFQTLIIDSIGLLAKVYRYGDAAFVGGGFKENGLHNTLEAATFGMPICFGPKINRFPEASNLLKAGVASVVNTEIEFTNWVQQYLNNHELKLFVAQKSKSFVLSNLGATTKVVKFIKQDLQSKLIG